MMEIKKLFHKYSYYISNNDLKNLFTIVDDDKDSQFYINYTFIFLLFRSIKFSRI